MCLSPTGRPKTPTLQRFISWSVRLFFPSLQAVTPSRGLSAEASKKRLNSSRLGRAVKEKASHLTFESNLGNLKRTRTTCGLFWTSQNVPYVQSRQNDPLHQVRVIELCLTTMPPTSMWWAAESQARGRE